MTLRDELLEINVNGNFEREEAVKLKLRRPWSTSASKLALGVPRDFFKKPQ